jgi:hypothetical protein
MTSGGMIYMLYLVKIHLLIQTLLEGTNMNGHTDMMMS